MIGARIVAWILFAAWSAWLVGVQAWLGGDAGAARWMPDLGLVLALSLLAHAEVADAPILAFIAALARSAFSSEPPLVLLTGCLIVVFLALAARSAIELSGPAWRAFAAVACVLVFDAWLGIAQSTRVAAGVVRTSPMLVPAWRGAAMSGVCALFLGPLLARLPGLTPIRRRRW